MEEVLMQMVDILEDTLLATNNHVINSRQMLGVLWQANTTRVGDDGDVEFGSHEQNGDDLVDTAEAAGVDLADVDCAAGEELLEHDAVLAHFARGDANVVGF